MLTLYQKDFYHPSVCDMCKSTKNLKTCGKCKTLSYCSKYHQIADWSSHKKLCKVISDTDKELLKFKDKINRDAYFIRVKAMWTKKLNRSTTVKEDDIIKYRKICLVCASTNVIVGCDKCSSVFYCSVDHQKLFEKQHSEYCAKIKCNFNLLLHHYKTLVPKIPLLTRKKISLTWLPDNLTKLFNYLEKHSHLGLTILNFLECLVLTDYFAPIATILFALERSSLLKKRIFHREELVVHIVGVDFEERSWYWCLLLEFSFHWIKNLKKLTFIAVGPKAGSWNYSLMNMSAICGFCNMNTSNIKVFSSPNYYHDVIDELEKPDIVVAFNCGLFEMSSWIKSIPSLTKYPGVPLTLTDFTLEYLEKDFALVENGSEREIETILKPRLNPFSCKSPQRNDFQNHPICYNNEYITVLKAK